MRLLRLKGLRMRLKTTICRGIFALLLILGTISGAAESRAADRCISWSEARSAGLIDKFSLRPASDIKTRVESRYGGKVVSFQICQLPDGLIYKLAVFRSNGNVLFVTEPAEPKE